MDPSPQMANLRGSGWLVPAIVTLSALLSAVSALAADTIDGRVLAGGAPVARSTVTLWSASADTPKQLGQAQTADDGRFTLSFESPASSEGTLYIIAQHGEPSARRGGDNLALALLSVIGSKPLAHVTIDEFTTIASVWTHTQFLKGTAIRGNALSLK